MVTLSARGAHEMTECWVCAHAAEGRASPSSDPTSVGVCWRCSIFCCDTHAEFDTLAGLFYCSPCVSDGESSPPTEPPGGGPGGGGPGLGRPRGRGERPIPFISALNAKIRFPRLHKSSMAHVDPFLARYEISEVIRVSARPWQDLFGERINVHEVDEELVALGIGMTLWSAGLDPGELPAVLPENLSWLVRNPILRVFLGELEIA